MTSSNEPTNNQQELMQKATSLMETASRALTLAAQILKAQRKGIGVVKPDTTNVTDKSEQSNSLGVNKVNKNITDNNMIDNQLNHSQVKLDKKKATSSGEKSKKPRDPNIPKKPPNAFLSYCTEVRSSVKKNNPHLDGRRIMAEISALWKALSAEEKRPYEERFKRDWGEFQREYKEYQEKNILVDDKILVIGYGDDDQLLESLSSNPSPVTASSSNTTLKGNGTPKESLKRTLNEYLNVSPPKPEIIDLDESKDAKELQNNITSSDKKDKKIGKQEHQIQLKGNLDAEPSQKQPLNRLNSPSKKKTKNPSNGEINSSMASSPKYIFKSKEDSVLNFSPKKAKDDQFIKPSSPKKLKDEAFTKTSSKMKQEDSLTQINEPTLLKKTTKELFLTSKDEDESSISIEEKKRLKAERKEGRKKRRLEKELAQEKSDTRIEPNSFNENKLYIPKTKEKVDELSIRIEMTNQKAENKEKKKKKKDKSKKHKDSSKNEGNEQK
ncbi:hypothetical protein G9A89_004350 [Geosiphon pyriformis]|nr:hypothetical protein G9A89_004350 [Geosiphon pyriformis]